MAPSGRRGRDKGLATVRKPIIEYEGNDPDKPAPAPLGIVSLILSACAIIMHLLVAVVASFDLVPEHQKPFLIVAGIFALACLLLSFVLGSIAWFDEGRNRRQGLLAIGISAGWLLVCAGVAISHA